MNHARSVKTNATLLSIPRRQGGADHRVVPRSGGAPLPASERAHFEPVLGFDLSHIRIYDGSEAWASANALGAKAFTVGTDIVFGRNQYQPGTERGRSLIAHEIVHAAQQRSARLLGPPEVASSDHPLEQNAEAVLSRAAPVGMTDRLLVQRAPDGARLPPAPVEPDAPAPPLEVTVDTVLLKPAADTIDEDFAAANRIYNRYGIYVKRGRRRSLEPEETASVLGEGRRLEITKKGDSAGEKRLFGILRTEGRSIAYWIPSASSKSLGGQSYPEQGALVVNAPNRKPDTFAHELGHILGEDHLRSPLLEGKFCTDGGNICALPEDILTNPRDPAVQKNLMAAAAIRITRGKDIDQLDEDQLRRMRTSRFLKPLSTGSR